MKKLRPYLSLEILDKTRCSNLCLPLCYPKIHRFKIFRSIILSVVLYGCEKSSFTLSEERGLRVFENRVLRRTFGPKRDEVTGERRKLHNEELYDLYCLTNIPRVIKSRRMRWAGYVASMGKRIGIYRDLEGKSEGKCPLGSHSCWWEYNIKMDLQEV